MKRFYIGVAMALGATLGVGIAHNQAQAEETARKIKLCHGTASATNPYVLIYVDQNALKGHFDGTAPGHGKNNAPDFISRDGTCTTLPPSGEQPS